MLASAAIAHPMRQPDGIQTLTSQYVEACIPPCQRGRGCDTTSVGDARPRRKAAVMACIKRRFWTGFAPPGM